MIQIDCPHCGPRDENEFICGGEAHISRPANPESISDRAWADYMFFRENPRGLHKERWFHSHGCRQWFNIIRCTVTHKVKAVYPIDAEAPSLVEVDS